MFKSNNNIIENCYFEDTVPQIQRGRDTYGIYAQESNDNTLRNNTIIKYVRGLEFYGCKRNIIQNLSINNTFLGISLSDQNENMLFENLTITEVYNTKPEPDEQMSAGIYFYFINNHIRIQNCSIKGSGSSYTFGIWWNDPMNSRDHYIRNCTIENFDIAVSTNPVFGFIYGSISGVTIEDSKLYGDMFSFRGVYEMNYWNFTNVSFIKTASTLYQGFELGVVNIFNHANNIKFQDCIFTSTDAENSNDKMSGLVVSNYYNDLLFDLNLINCSIFNNSENGITIEKQDYSISGTLSMDNSNIFNNYNYGLYWKNTKLILDAKNSDFSNNELHGIHIESPLNSEIDIQNSTISNNNDTGVAIIDAEPYCEINFKNTTVESNKFDGLETIDSNCKITLKDSVFTLNKQYGLNITGGTAEVQNSEILSNSNTGILIKDSRSYIHNTTISSNKGSGLFIENSNSDISYNTISENLDTGIDFYLSKGNISNNIINNNNKEGIKIRNSNKDTFVKNNELDQNGIKDGLPTINIMDSSLVITNNTFSSYSQLSSNIGLKVHNSVNININDNIFNGSFSQSLIDISFSEVDIINNQLLKCQPQCNGIFSNYESSIQIINNDIIAPGNYGIYLSSESSGSIVNNLISQWYTGVYLSDSTSFLENNTIWDSKNYGVIINDNSKATLTNNLIRNNENGIRVEGSAILNNNQIHDSRLIGIYLKQSSGVSVLRNDVKGNNIGLLINGGTFTTNQNMFNGNEFGISLFNSDGITLENDVIENNNVGIKAENSIFNVSRYFFYNNKNSITLQNSISKIYNSTIKDSEIDFILDETSKCWVINTDMTSETIDILDFDSKLYRQWYLNITIMDQQNNLLSGVRVIIKDRGGIEQFNQTTSNDGAFNNLNLTSMSWEFDGMFNPNPYEIIISKKMYGTTSNNLVFSGNTNLNLTALRLSELITNIEATDFPDDQGGRIILNWSSIPIINFGNFNIYVSTGIIPAVESFMLINSSITDQGINSTIIEKINGESLENGNVYYFALAIVDNNGNVDLNNIKFSNPVIPSDDISPFPIKNITVYDTPNDNGGSITIAWAESEAIDFNHYDVYCFQVNLSIEIDLLNLTPDFKIFDITDTIGICYDLENNISYYVVILVFDKNNNVNLSYILAGPISPFDNIPPIINRNISNPSVLDDLEFKNNDQKVFKIYLETQEEVTFKWYIDGELIEQFSDSSVIITMSDLSIDDHVLKAVVEEQSGLQDSLEWHFTVSKAPTTTGKESDSYSIMLFWIAIVIIIIILLSFAVFGIRHVGRFRDASNTIKAVSTLEIGQAMGIIENKRKTGTQYVLIKLVKELPEAMKNQPDKLFFILNNLAKDDISEVRENAARNIAKLLDKNPNKIFIWFQALQRNGTSKSEDEYRSNLENISSVLVKTEGLKFGMEMNLIYSALKDFYKYRTISKISTSKPVIVKIQNLRSWAPEILTPYSIEVFNKLGTVAESIEKYERSDSIEEKLSYLSLGLNIVEDAFRITREKLQSPERDVFFLVLNSWRNIISLNIRELRGRADLRIKLIGKEMIIQQDTIILMLDIKNKGRSMAERLLVELVPSLF
jgi:parallel beta-helix repeat protein